MAALDGVEEDFGGFLDALEEGVVFVAAGRGFLVWVMLENLLAVGTLNLLFSGLVAVLGDTEDGVVILLLCISLASSPWLQRSVESTYLPLLSISLQHHWILGLADLAVILILNLLDILSGLNALILRERALEALSASVGKEVSANGLNGTVNWAGKAGDSFEIFFCGPARRQDRQRECNLSGGRHFASFETARGGLTF